MATQMNVTAHMLLLADIEKAIDAVAKWLEIPPPKPTCNAFEGAANGWRILTVRFPLPAPIPMADGEAITHGYDGTALHMRLGTVVRLPAAQAERAARAAMPKPASPAPKPEA